MRRLCCKDENQRPACENQKWPTTGQSGYVTLTGKRSCAKQAGHFAAQRRAVQGSHSKCLCVIKTALSNVSWFAQPELATRTPTFQVGTKVELVYFFFCRTSGKKKKVHDLRFFSTRGLQQRKKSTRLHFCPYAIDFVPSLGTHSKNKRNMYTTALQS